MRSHYVYILENPEAQRVKVGTTINDPAERCKSVNDQWIRLTATCQVCGGRRLTNLKNGLMPEHTTAGAHSIQLGHCPGSFNPPLESDQSLAESHLVELRRRYGELSGSEKGSVTRMINNLERRIERFRRLEVPVGSWRVAVVFLTKNEEEVEKRTHQLLQDYLDHRANLGEVFRCSVQEAAAAVEEVLGLLGLLESAISYNQVHSENPSSQQVIGQGEPERRSATFECVKCRFQWQGVEPGLNPCPKCETHLFRRLVGYL